MSEPLDLPASTVSATSSVSGATVRKANILALSLSATHTRVSAKLLLLFPISHAISGSRTAGNLLWRYVSLLTKTISTSKSKATSTPHAYVLGRAFSVSGSRNTPYQRLRAHLTSMSKLAARITPVVYTKALSFSSLRGRLVPTIHMGLIARAFTSSRFKGFVYNLLYAVSNFITTAKPAARMYFSNPNFIDYKAGFTEPYKVSVKGPVVLSTKDPTETIIITYDFTRYLGVGEVILSVNSINIVTFEGIDNTPNLTAVGLTQITGNQVEQLVGGGLDKSIYKIKVVVSTSFGQVLSSTAVLPVAVQ